jgi:hypothetical protein
MIIFLREYFHGSIAEQEQFSRFLNPETPTWGPFGPQLISFQCLMSFLHLFRMNLN